MRRFLLVAMVCGAVTGAQAADMPDLPFLRGSVTDGLTSSGVNWQGFYVGGQASYGSVTSKVASGANKIEIKRAVEQLLGSKVSGIRTSIAHGKVKRQGRFAGRRSDWKKAYVKLREGQKIPEFLEGA